MTEKNNFKPADQGGRGTIDATNLAALRRIAKQAPRPPRSSYSSCGAAGVMSVGGERDADESEQS